MKSKKRIKVALYPRVSTQEQARDGYSVGEQIERLKMYCEAMGWDVYKTYTDAGYSGGNIDRPGLQDMIQDVKDGKIDKVLVYKLDRLSRSQKDTLELIEDVFLANNTDFVSMSENFDTSTPFGRAMIGILAVFAQLEREQIKERMFMGKSARAKKGLYHGGGKIPIGYDYIDGKLVVNEYEKMQVLELFEKFNAGVPFRQIEFGFKEKGYTHKTGKWGNKTLRRVLQNPVYIGYLRHGENEDNPQLIKGIHEPILDMETFSKTQELLRIRKENYNNGRRKTAQKYYLTGLIECKWCGARYHCMNMGGGHRTPKHYYMCYSRSKSVISMIKDPNCKNKNYNRVKLEEIIFDEIKKLALDPNYYHEVKREKNGDKIDRAEILRKEIKKIDDQISKLMDLYSLNALSIEDVTAKIDPLADKKKNIDDELKKLDEKKPILNEEDTFKIINSFAELLEEGDYNTIKTALDTLINKIIVDGEDLTIHWNFE